MRGAAAFVATTPPASCSRCDPAQTPVLPFCISLRMKCDIDTLKRMKMLYVKVSCPGDTLPESQSV
ncbi:hypothetical protein PAMP_023218 [Pampus punctatissimus]